MKKLISLLLVILFSFSSLTVSAAPLLFSSSIQSATFDSKSTSDAAEFLAFQPKTQATPSTTASDKSPTFRIEFSKLDPGEFIVIRADNLPVGNTITVESSIDFTPNFFDDGAGGQLALFPISYRNDPDTYRFTVSGGGKRQSFRVKINPKKFQVQHLQASEETAQQTLLSKEANEEFEKHIAPLRPVADKTAYWKQADFIWPVSTSKITTQYGMMRYVNGMPTSYRHGAIDFAVPLGTPVKATNHGRVLYAGYLKLTGYTVLIEHGFGLKSWYYHMDSLDIKTGDTVTVGQKIGAVGSTGFSTGPHLHFGMSVNNVFVNPSTIVDGGALKETFNKTHK